MGPIDDDKTPYVVVGYGGNIVARCSDWDDAVIIAGRHGQAHIHSTNNGVDYYRHERMVISYNPKQA